jgi:hypothetical protein
MANLRVDKITSTETFETTGSVQFDGSGDYLKVSGSETISDGNGDFTIEGWLYKNSAGVNAYFFDGRPSPSASAGNPLIYITGDNLRFYRTSVHIQTTIELNKWIHIALTRESDVYKLWIDGSLRGIHRDSTSVNLVTTTSPILGMRSSLDDSYPLNGFISNFRIVKGKALYTENFKVPMRELEVTPETVLLACQSKTDASHEKTGKTITVAGNAVASELTPGLITDIVKSGGSSAITGSVEFDGTGDYLSLDDSDDFNIGSGDFTIEFWVNPGRTTRQTLFTQINSSGTNASSSFYTEINSSGQWRFAIASGSTLYEINAGTVTANEWTYLAYVRNGNTTTLYVNGVSVGTSDVTGVTANNSSEVVSIGRYPGGLNFAGFISNLRVVKGTALYTADFIPPTRELKKVPGTVLLCCQDSNDPTTEATGKTITGYGDLEQDPPELVTDGGFASATNWSSAGADWTISGGVATISSANSGFDFLGTLTSNTTNGLLYELRFDISSWTAGRLELAQSGSGNIGVSVTGNGSYTFRFRYTGTTNGNISLYSYTDTTSSFTLDDVSLKRVSAKRKGSNFTPQVGDDRKVTLEGVTKINTENYFYLPTGDTESRDKSAGIRGVFTAGYQAPAVPSQTNVIDYINISSTGNAKDFGDTTNSRWGVGSCSSSTRGLIGGGYTPVNLNVIDHITIASTGDAQDFGDLTNPRRALGSCSSSTRGIFAGGYLTSPTVLYNVIDYVTIASKGDAKDFGDTTFGGAYKSSFSSPTRGVIAGNYLYGETPNINDVIDYITIASTGDAQDFGDLTQSKSAMGGASNNVRGLFGGGFLVPTRVSDVDYITIASKGDAQDFGDLLNNTMTSGGTSSQTRGIFGGGSPTTNIIQYVTIMSTGNATDFGDLSVARGYVGAFSNGHGGLG